MPNKKKPFEEEEKNPAFQQKSEEKIEYKTQDDVSYLVTTTDSPAVLQEVLRITRIEWPPEAGKRPPRDMKRLEGKR